MPGKLWWTCTCGNWDYARVSGEDKCSRCGRAPRPADAKWLTREFQRRGIIPSVPDNATLEDFISVGATKTQRKWAKRQAARARREAELAADKDKNDKESKDNSKAEAEQLVAELPEIDRRIKELDGKLEQIGKSRELATEFGWDVEAKEAMLRNELDTLR